MGGTNTAPGQGHLDSTGSGSCGDRGRRMVFCLADPNAVSFQRLKNALEFGKGGVT